MNKKTTFSRREFLKVAWLTTLGIVCSQNPLLAIAQDTKNQTDEVLEKDPKNGSFSLVNNITAWAVFAGFSKSVLFEGLFQWKNLWVKDAAQQILLAWARISTLKNFWWEKWKELWEEEQEELTSPASIIPIAILIVLSDMSQDISVDPNEFIKTCGLNIEDMDYSNVVRPSIDADILDWKNYLENINIDLKTQTKNIASIATILWLAGTTYTSSSLTNQLKVWLSRIVFEQSFAKTILEKKEKKAPIDEIEIVDRAIHRTDQLINGPAWFSKMAIALYANWAGNAVIGNPPEIYFLMEFATDPEMMAINESLWLAFWEISTIAMNARWLKKAGITLNPSDIKDIVSSQIEVLKWLSESFANSSLRNASFGDGQKWFENLLHALKDWDETQKKIYEALKKTAHAKIHFSSKEYFQKKAEALRSVISWKSEELWFVQTIVNLMERSDGTDINEVYVKLFQWMKEGKYNQIEVAVTEVVRIIQSNEASKCAVMFWQYIKNYEISWNVDIDIDGSWWENLSIEKLNGLVEKLQSLIDSSKDLTNDDRIEESISILQAQSPNGIPQLAKTLSKNGSDTFKNAFTRFSDPKPIEDRFSWDAELSEDESSALMWKSLEEATEIIHSDVEKHVLSHTAQEVMYALLTQVPSVPAMKSLAKTALYTILGLKEWEKPNKEDLKKTIPIVATLTLAISAVDDNVAAYLFGRGVLESFFKEVYGNDVLEKNKDLQIAIVIIEKMIAEMAWSLTKVWNWPNFSQKKIEILKDEDDHQWISLDQIDMPMPETLKNNFAQSFSALVLAGWIAYLSSMIDQIEIQ